MPYILLRWYTLQVRRQAAQEDIRRLDLSILALCEDPGELYSDMRRDLMYAYEHGMPAPESFLTPGEFRARVEATLSELGDG